MKRREFGKSLAAGAALATASRSAPAQGRPANKPKKNLLMHVGGDYHSIAGGPNADMTAKANLEYNLRHGVKHLTAQVRNIGADGAWDSDELKRMRDNCDKAGMTFEAIRMDSEYIMLPKGGERDRRLDAIMENIQKASQVGVKVITHHWTVIPIRRNSQTAGGAEQHMPPSSWQTTGKIFRSERPAASARTSTGSGLLTFFRK